MKGIEMEEKFEKITNVRLPLDRRHKDASKNYGIHGLDIWFILKGKKGAVQYAVTMPIYLPHIKIEHSFMQEIRGFDVGYHALEPQYEGQKSMECDLYGKCYYDGSSFRSNEWTKEIFSTIGEAPENILWKKLEEEYELRFEL